MKINLFLILLLCSFFAHAQQVELKGKIMNDNGVEGVHILNNRAKRFTVTNVKGEFFIEAKKNDTIYFNSLVFKLQGIVVTQQMIENKTMAVSLEEDVNQLEEVVVGRTLTGNINEDLKQVKLKDTINFDDVGIPGFKGEPEEKIVPIIPAVGFGVVLDIEALYKHASGYYKSLKIGRKWDKQDKTLIKVYDHYGHDFFIDTYAIDENLLYEFLLTCVEREGFVRDFNTRKFELILKAFEEESEKFNEE